MSVTTDQSAATRWAIPDADPLSAAVQRALAHLRDRQHPDGWWKGELETNVTMDAEDLLMRHVLGISTPEGTAATARWIRSQQRADGSWAVFTDGPGDCSTTVEAWVALRLAGDDPAADHLVRAASFARAAGGVAATRVFTRIWLALVGLHPWDQLPALPPEVVLLPRWMPLNIYDFACWARQTIVPLTLVAAHRPVHPVPFDIAELIGDGSPARTTSVGWRFFDRMLHAYDRHPIAPLRRLALRRARRWVLDRQEADGSWGGIQPPWVYSLMALVLTGSTPDSPELVRGLAGLEGFTLTEQGPDGPVRRLEACQSPVWDTGLAVTALRDVGVPADDDAVARAAGWLLAEEIDVGGDWAVRRPGLAPGGWAFEFANVNYADTDDTAEVLLALRRSVPRVASGNARQQRDAAITRGLDWLVGMQCRDGGWGAFDADNTSSLPDRLPFCDFGEVVDPPSADVTGHIVEALAIEGRTDSLPCRRGVRWLLDAQEERGSWFGRWGVNHLYGTGAVVPGLIAAGVPASDPAIRRAVAWLEQVQQADGGWGEDVRSYTDPAWIGRGDPMPAQTAWALLALLAAGERGPAVSRGVGWLVRHQRADGGWDEPHHTGTGFPGDFSINYHLYRVVFPLSALGRARAAGVTAAVDAS